MNSLAPDTLDLRHVIDPRVTEIMMQFNVWKPSLLPRNFTWEEKPPNPNRSADDYQLRRFIKAERIGIHAFALELQSQGFVMSHARALRQPASEPDARPRHRMRFIFEHSAGLSLNREQVGYIANIAIPTFAWLCKTAAWDVEGFRNDIPGGESICINCGGRVPYRHPDGSVNRMRKRDALGRLNGEPVPFVPQKFLRIEERHIVVT